MKAHRAILIPLPPECDAQYIWRLMALTNLAYRGYAVMVPDMPRYVQHQLLMWCEFKQSLVFGVAPKKWLTKTWIPLKTCRIFPDGRRIGDPAAQVVLDFTHNVIRVRQICRNQKRYSVELSMPEWALKRVAEGGDVKFAIAGVRRGRPYLALVTEREVQPVQPSDYVLVVDVNSWKHGIAWALIKGDKIIKWVRERPNLGYIERIYGELVILGRKYGMLRRLGLHRSPEGRKLWRKIKRVKRKLYAYLRNFAQNLASRLARKAVRHRTRVVIDVAYNESLQELLEEKISSSLTKIYFSGVRRFVNLFTNQLRWYGISYEFKRLHSTVCPKCSSKMEELPGRTVKCKNCNFIAHRDLVPAIWYIVTQRNGTQ